MNHLVAAQLNKTKLCTMFSRGSCNDGKCRFAHSMNELRSLPDLSKTAICRAFARGKCPDPSCKFAHGEQELRVTPSVYKTQLCNFFARGHCKKGDRCRHAHGHRELRSFQGSATPEPEPEQPAAGVSVEGQACPLPPGLRCLAGGAALPVGAQPVPAGVTEERPVLPPGLSLTQDLSMPGEVLSPCSSLVTTPIGRQGGPRGQRPASPPAEVSSEAPWTIAAGEAQGTAAEAVFHTPEKAEKAQRPKKERRGMAQDKSFAEAPMKIQLPALPILGTDAATSPLQAATPPQRFDTGLAAGHLQDLYPGIFGYGHALASQFPASPVLMPDDILGQHSLAAAAAAAAAAQSAREHTAAANAASAAASWWANAAVQHASYRDMSAQSLAALLETLAKPVELKPNPLLAPPHLAAGSEMRFQWPRSEDETTAAAIAGPDSLHDDRKWVV